MRIHPLVVVGLRSCFPVDCQLGSMLIKEGKATQFPSHMTHSIFKLENHMLPSKANVFCFESLGLPLCYQPEKDFLLIKGLCDKFRLT